MSRHGWPDVSDAEYSGSLYTQWWQMWFCLGIQYAQDSGFTCVGLQLRNTAPGQIPVMDITWARQG